MNTRPLSRPATFRDRTALRAELSPVRSIRLTTADRSLGVSEAQSASGAAPAASTSLPPHWPAWHRGALDRLQPLLTRYRD